MKPIALTLFLIPAIVVGTIIYGGPGERIRGYPPGDTLVCTLYVTVKVPARIGLYVNGNTEFDLGDPALTYPPALFPGYYDPTSVSGTNTDGVNVQVFSNHPTMTWHLETKGSGDFSETIALGQVFYAPNGEPNPPDGANPPGGNWQSFTTTYTEIATGEKTSGWLAQDQDYIFQAQIDDEPTPASGETVRIDYLLYGL